jgi:hypothetical protein
MKRKRVERPWTPFERVTPNADYPIQPGEEVWINSRYQVYLRRIESKKPGEDVLTHLSIKRHDKQEIRDWRDFQRIKNELVGPETEGIELYPAESRLVDTANQYHLWVFPYRLPIGFDRRIVSDASYRGSVQRPWDEGQKPADALDQARVDQLVDDYFHKRKEG